MITSKKEAIYYIIHTEQQYEWGEISETALREKLEYFLEVLKDYDYSEYCEQRARLNEKYGFSL